eukprot:403346123
MSASQNILPVQQSHQKQKQPHISSGTLQQNTQSKFQAAKRKNYDSKMVDPFPKRTVSVLLNSEVLRDLRVFILFDSQYECIRYIDIIIKKPQQSTQVLRTAKEFINSQLKNTPANNPKNKISNKYLKIETQIDQLDDEECIDDFSQYSAKKRQVLLSSAQKTQSQNLIEEQQQTLKYRTNDNQKNIVININSDQISSNGIDNTLNQTVVTATLSPHKITSPVAQRNELSSVNQQQRVTFKNQNMPDQYQSSSQTLPGQMEVKIFESSLVEDENDTPVIMSKHNYEPSSVQTKYLIEDEQKSLYNETVYQEDQTFGGASVTSNQHQQYLISPRLEGENKKQQNPQIFNAKQSKIQLLETSNAQESLQNQNFPEVSIQNLSPSHKLQNIPQNNMDPSNLIEMFNKKLKDNRRESYKKTGQKTKNDLEDSLEFIQRKMYAKDMNHYFPNYESLRDVMNQIFYSESPQDILAQTSPNKNNVMFKEGFKYLYSINGEVLNFGFEEINELEDYVFLVDKATFQTNNLKLLYFITNFQQYVKKSNLNSVGQATNPSLDMPMIATDQQQPQFLSMPNSLLKSPNANKNQEFAQTKKKKKNTGTIFRKICIKTRTKDNTVVINNNSNDIEAFQKSRFIQPKNKQDDENNNLQDNAAIIIQMSQMFQDPEKIKIYQKEVLTLKSSINAPLKVRSLSTMPTLPYLPNPLKKDIGPCRGLFKQNQSNHPDFVSKENKALQRTKNIMTKIQQRKTKETTDLLQGNGICTQDLGTSIRMPFTQRGSPLKSHRVLRKLKQPVVLPPKSNEYQPGNKIKNLDLEESMNHFSKYYNSTQFESRLQSIINSNRQLGVDSQSQSKGTLMRNQSTEHLGLNSGRESYMLQNQQTPRINDESAFRQQEYSNTSQIIKSQNSQKNINQHHSTVYEEESSFIRFVKQKSQKHKIVNKGGYSQSALTSMQNSPRNLISLKSEQNSNTLQTNMNPISQKSKFYEQKQNSAFANKTNTNHFLRLPMSSVNSSVFSQPKQSLSSQMSLSSREFNNYTDHKHKQISTERVMNEMKILEKFGDLGQDEEFQKIYENILSKMQQSQKNQQMPKQSKRHSLL